MIDLHCHSDCSDGELSPEELVLFASQRGITTLALTDHDTVVGIERAVIAAKTQAIHIIPGVEITAKWKKYDLHVVATNIAYDSPNFLAFLDKQQSIRNQRAALINEKFHEIGIKDVLNDAKKWAKNGNITRPHFARVLLERGLCKDMAAAFRQYLARGKPAFVPTAWPELGDVIDAIHDADGQAILAHPMRYKLTMTKLKQLLQDFSSLGGVALEVVSGQCHPREVQQLAALCQQFDLLGSQGSDFHSRQWAPIMMGKLVAMPAQCRPVWHDWEGIN